MAPIMYSMDFVLRHVTASDASLSVESTVVHVASNAFWHGPPTVDTMVKVSGIIETEGITEVESIGCPLEEDAACEETCAMMSSRCALVNFLQV